MWYDVVMEDFYHNWTWEPREFAWFKGHSLNGMGVYNDQECDDFWQYNIVIDGEIVVMGEGKFTTAEECQRVAETDFHKRKAENGQVS
jgi:hypothetical protein